MSKEQLDKLRKAVDYLETANGIIEEDGGDEDDAADASETVAEARTALAEIEGLLKTGGWIKTMERLPERVLGVSYSSVRCLVVYKGEVQILVYNHEHTCWDDRSGDDYKCDPLDVECWQPLPEAPGRE